MNNTIQKLEMVDIPLKTGVKNGATFGLMTTISTQKDCRVPKLRVNYKKKVNPFSTPDTNVLAQISQLSCGKTILDFI